jgi:hypothetical protein
MWQCCTDIRTPHNLCAKTSGGGWGVGDFFLNHPPTPGWHHDNVVVIADFDALIFVLGGRVPVAANVRSRCNCVIN